MARRSKGARARIVRAVPPPIQSAYSSAYTTPVSSAYPSAYPSEDESYTKQLAKNPPIQTRRKKKRPTKPFRFLDLPPELRLRVYEFHFEDCGNVLDLNSANRRDVIPQLALLRTCKDVYNEASHFFFSNKTFRIFPCGIGFHKTKRPLLSRLKPQQRGDLRTLNLLLGPGWNRPPKGWVVNDKLGLKQCTNVHTVKVLVECDPSNPMYDGWRVADGFYEEFCRNLLEDVLADLPSVQNVEFDAVPSVSLSGLMMKGLLSIPALSKLQVLWGPDRGWADEEVRLADGIENIDLSSDGEDSVYSIGSVVVKTGYTVMV